MIKPSYIDLMEIANADVEPGEAPVVESRYSIVTAAAKRARQLVDGAEPLAESKSGKPLSNAVEELRTGKVKILCEGSNDEDSYNGMSTVMDTISITAENDDENDVFGEKADENSDDENSDDENSDDEDSDEDK